MHTAKRQKPAAKQNNPPVQGLRERKKNKTRKMIQHEALRLFRLQGYEATTISQIAEAAEISESTFFRYFPTKEAIVRWDEFDPLIIAAFKRQPPKATSLTALRGAFREVLGSLSAEERVDLRERILLGFSVPHTLGAAQLAGPLHLLREMMAKRAGRKPDDFRLRIMVGAVLGAVTAAMGAAEADPGSDIVTLLDQTLAQLEAGFSF